MQEFQPMSPSEEQVMELLWREGQPVTSAWVIEQLQQGKAWKPSTVWTFLGRLVEKGYIHAQKAGKRSLYSPLLSREEYLHARTRHFLNAVHGGSVKSFFAALGGGGSVDEATLSQLEALLDKVAEKEE